ncbi:MAG: substrate-binding domain-containing protein, partial [Pseudomonadota bacterium]
VRHGTVDGLIFTAASHQAASIDAALDRNVPTVLFNRPLDGVPCDQVVSTNRDGAAAVAQYLVSGGRRRIAYLSGPLDRTTLAARAEGFCEGLAAVGHPLWRRGGEDTFFDHDRFREIAIGLMQGPEPCDAIACGNDVIAFAVLNGLTAIGVSVPDDVWVVGFDGVTMSGWDVFDLTTMRQPWDVMADGAVSALIDRIECRRTSPRTIQARTDLLVRGSTAHWPATHRDALAQTTNHKGRIP